MIYYTMGKAGRATSTFSLKADRGAKNRALRYAKFDGFNPGDVITIEAYKEEEWYRTYYKKADYILQVTV